MAASGPEPGVGLKRTSVAPDGTRLDHLPELTPDERRRRHGSVALEPLAGTSLAEIVAGEPLGLGFVYRAGENGLPAGGRLGVAWRLPGDWGEPQFERPDAANFVRAGGDAGVALAFGHRAGVPPWGHLLSATLLEPLPPGGMLTLLCGDPDGGGPGWEAQTSSLPDHRFLVAVRHSAADPWRRLADPPALRIRGGPATTLRLVVPSDGVVGEPFAAILRGVDVWGNPSRGLSGEPELSAPGLEPPIIERLAWDDEEHDLWRIEARFAQPGLHRMRARIGDLEAEGNPLRCRREAPGRALYWGDLHGGQGDLGVGQGSLERYFAYARRVAGLQFTSHQANDVYVTRADWRHTRRVTRTHHRPGAFLAVLGCEWTAFRENGGDHNIFYRHDREVLQRAQRWFDDPDDDWPDAPTPPDLYRSLEGSEALVNLHVGGFTSDLEHHDPRFETMIEIHCTHATSRWFVIDALARGRRLGIVGSSDGVSGRPGADHPGRRQSRNLTQGVTGVWAEALGHEALWEALRARRCYATSGERIALWVESEGRAMGEAFATEAPPAIRVRVAGTAAIDRLLLRRGGEVVATRRVAGSDPAHPDRYRLLWSGSRERGTSRDQKLVWDGGLTISPGRIAPVDTVGFLPPIDRLDRSGDAALVWSSVTAGNEAGAIFDLDAPPDARLAFDTRPFAFDLGRRELDAGVAFDLPDLLDGGIRAGRTPDPEGAREWEGDLRDPGRPPPGVHPYWVEVVQIDGARAWSSPLWVRLEPERDER